MGDLLFVGAMLIHINPKVSQLLCHSQEINKSHKINFSKHNLKYFYSEEFISYVIAKTKKCYKG